MATARTANPAPMAGLNKPANGQLRGQTKTGGQQSELLSNVQHPSAHKRTSIPQSSGGIK